MTKQYHVKAEVNIYVTCPDCNIQTKVPIYHKLPAQYVYCESCDAELVITELIKEI